MGESKPARGSGPRSHLRPVEDWRPTYRERRPRVATIAELSKEYQALLDAQRDRSRKDRASVVRAFAVAFGDMLPDAVAPGMVEEHLAKLVESGRAGKTVRKYHALVCTFLDWAKRTGAATENAARQVSRGVLPRNAPIDELRTALEVLTIEELTRLLHDASIPYHRKHLYRLTYWAGLRIGEGGGLDMRHLVWKEPLWELLVEQQWSTKYQELRTPKAANRHTPVSIDLQASIEEREGWFRATFRRPSEPNDPICPFPKPWREVGRYQQQVALRWFRRDLLDLGIPVPSTGERSIHCLRHSWATHAAAAGVDRKAVQAILHGLTSKERERTATGAYIHVFWPWFCREVGRVSFDPARVREVARPEQLEMFRRAPR